MTIKRTRKRAPSLTIGVVRGLQLILRSSTKPTDIGVMDSREYDQAAEWLLATAEYRQMMEGSYGRQIILKGKE